MLRLNTFCIKYVLNINKNSQNPKNVNLRFYLCSRALEQQINALKQIYIIGLVYSSSKYMYMYFVSISQFSEP